MSEARRAGEGQHRPGRCEIRVKGHLDALMADRFEGLSFSHTGDGTTTLSGPVVDQAALHGLLRRVRDLGLTLVSVLHFDAAEDAAPHASDHAQQSRSQEEADE